METAKHRNAKYTGESEDMPKTDNPLTNLKLSTAKSHNASLTGESELMPNRITAKAVNEAIKMIRKPDKKKNWKKLADNAFSLLIRTEASFRCQFHSKLLEKGIVAPCSCNDVMQCCHKISRGKGAIRYDTRNVLCGCSGSNTWAHYHEAEWSELWKKLYPEDVEYLESIKNKECHRKAWDYKIMIDEYKRRIAEIS